MKVTKKVQAFFGMALLGVASAVSAIPITGEIGMGGNYAAVTNSWRATSVGLAAGIDFNPNLFIVGNATGSFAGVGSIGNIQDFQFDGGLGINDGFGGVTAVSSIVDFWTIDGFSFELTSVAQLASSTNTFLDLQGTGIITGNGFDATAGSWVFTGESSGSTFTWSAGTDVAESVPEPTIMALMGIGLLGFAVSRRRAKQA